MSLFTRLLPSKTVWCKSYGRGAVVGVWCVPFEFYSPNQQPAGFDGLSISLTGNVILISSRDLNVWDWIQSTRLELKGDVGYRFCEANGHAKLWTCERG